MRMLKYVLPGTGEVVVNLPRGATVRHVAANTRSADVTIWAEVDEDQQTERRLLYVIGTGDDVPSPLYLGSAHFPTYGEIWHVYDGGLAPSEEDHHAS